MNPQIITHNLRLLWHICCKEECPQDILAWTILQLQHTTPTQLMDALIQICSVCQTDRCKFPTADIALRELARLSNGNRDPGPTVEEEFWSRS